LAKEVQKKPSHIFWPIYILIEEQAEVLKLFQGTLLWLLIYAIIKNY